MVKHPLQDVKGTLPPDGVARPVWPLVLYFGLAFGLTWALLAVTRTSVPLSLLALCGPAAAALMAARMSGRDEWRALVARIAHWRVGVGWYLLALLLPVAVSALRSLLEFARGAEGPIRLQPISALGLVVFVLVAGEEIGWRGFALPKLRERCGPWTSSVILGTLWGLWHLPVFFLEGGHQVGHPFVPYLGYTIGLSILLTFLAERTLGSVLIATLFHGAVNTFGVVNTASDAALRGWANAVSYGSVALLVGSLAWSTRGAGTRSD